MAKSKHIDSEVHGVLDTLFQENSADVNKNQDYKDNFKEFELPKKYFLIEMYNKQKELQQFLANRGKTKSFPEQVEKAKQSDLQTAIYHLFCMQIELQELKVELGKIVKHKSESKQPVPEELLTSARYELIDIFFFMFNVGIYSGININDVVDYIENNDEMGIIDPDGTANLEFAVQYLLNYIDKLPWKAWKEYDYNTFYNKLDKQQLVKHYANAVKEAIHWAKCTFNENDKSLFNLYMNKWVENKRRQEDINSGYILNKPEGLDTPTGFPGDIAEAIDNNR